MSSKVNFKQVEKERGKQRQVEKGRGRQGQVEAGEAGKVVGNVPSLYIPFISFV